MDYRRHKTPNKRVSRKRTKVYAMRTDYGFDDHITHVIGIDEAGWGAIAGPLYVGGCIVRVDDNLDWLDVKDSKKYTTERAREIAYANIQRLQSLGKLEYFTWAIPPASVSWSPAKSLHQAQYIVCAALLGDGETPDKEAGVLVDGKTPIRGLKSSIPSRAIPKADALFKVVSAASVVAKVERDRDLTKLHERFPRFDFYKNKGYPTAQHLKLLKLHGASEEHRTNIAKVQEAQRPLNG